MFAVVSKVNSRALHYAARKFRAWSVIFTLRARALVFYEYNAVNAPFFQDNGGSLYLYPREAFNY
jgi:hypothetical protein